MIKREVIRIMQTFLSKYKARDVGNGHMVDVMELCNRFVPLLLKDFTESPECAKEPLELSFLSTMIESQKVAMRKVMKVRSSAKD